MRMIMINVPGDITSNFFLPLRGWVLEEFLGKNRGM